MSKLLRITALALFLGAIATTQSYAQLSITDGTSSYSKSTTNGAVDFNDQFAGDIASEERWIVRYRDLGGIGAPTVTTYLEVGGLGTVLDGVTNSGDTGTMNWSINSPTFGDPLLDIDITYTISTNADGTAFLTYDVDVIAQNGIPAGAVSVFNYFDYDLSGGSDSADAVVDGTTTTMNVRDTANDVYAWRSGENISGYEIRDWTGGGGNIDDDIVGSNTYVLNDTGSPFPAEDFTGAFQWDFNLGNVGSTGSFSGASSVPEPASAALLMLAGLGLACCRRRR